MTRRVRRAAPVLSLCAALLAGAAGATTPTALLFDTPHFATAVPGQPVAYERRRVADPALGLGPNVTEAVTVTPRPEGGTLVALTPEGGTTTTLPPFEGMPGNPLLMVFLERTARAVAQATGGSPFYLRNRMKAALRDGLREAAGPDGLRVITARPFADSPNAPRMGPFGALELRFHLADAQPGAFTLLRALAPAGAIAPAFLEEFRLAP